MSGIDFFEANAFETESEPARDAENSPRAILTEVGMTVAVTAAFVAAGCFALILAGVPAP